MLFEDIPIHIFPFSRGNWRIPDAIGMYGGSTEHARLEGPLSSRLATVVAVGARVHELAAGNPLTSRWGGLLRFVICFACRPSLVRIGIGLLRLGLGLFLGLGLRLLRDSKRGLAAKRFVVADPLTSVLSVIGTVLAGVAAELHFTAAPAVPGRSRQAAAVRVEHLAERAAVFVLQALGVKRAEAERIAQLPLPEVRDGNAAAAM